MPTSNVKYFAEIVEANGWVPLNFLSGGDQLRNDPTNHESWSEPDAKTSLIAFGVQAAF